MSATGFIVPGIITLVGQRADQTHLFLPLVWLSKRDAGDCAAQDCGTASAGVQERSARIANGLKKPAESGDNLPFSSSTDWQYLKEGA